MLAGKDSSPANCSFERIFGAGANRLAVEMECKAAHDISIGSGGGEGIGLQSSTPSMHEESELLSNKRSRGDDENSFGNISSISEEGNIKSEGQSDVGKLKAKKPKMGDRVVSDLIEPVETK